jgi:hypothetical protein
MTVIKKSLLSLVDTVFFFIISNPFTYKLVNKIFGLIRPNLIWDEIGGCPTTIGYFIHVLVYFLINFISMFLMKMLKMNDLSLGLMFKFTFIGTLIYVLFSNNQTYKLTSGILGNVIDSNTIAVNGCPKNLGIILHSGVFFITLLAMMYLPDDC